MPRFLPNIVWIYCDELRADALGCYASGQLAARTPNLDALCADGVKFTNHFVNSPICVSSRVALHTGRYPENTGVYGNEAAWAHYPGPADIVTLPRVLQHTGYRTADFGKEHVPRLMSVWEQHSPNGARPADLIDNLDGPSRATLVKSPTLGVIVAGFSPQARPYPPQIVTDGGLAWLESARSPFMLRLSYLQPHPPIIAPPRSDSNDEQDFEFDACTPTKLSDFESRFVALGGGSEMSARQLGHIRSTYSSIVEWLDEQVGRVVGTLDRLRLRDRTIVLFTSDHGAYLGEGGGFGKHTFAPHSHRVPLIISWPRTLPAGIVRDDINQGIDIFPTLFELAGLEPPPVDGRRLFSEPAPRHIFGTIGYGEAASCAFPNVGLGRYGNRGWPRRACIRSTRYRLDRNVRINGEPASERDWDVFLTDCAADPTETRNMAGDPALQEVQDDLLAALARHVATSKETDADLLYPSHTTRSSATYEDLHSSGTAVEHGAVSRPRNNSGE